MHNTWTVDEVDSLGQSDVLPRFSLARNWCCLATCFFHEGVDDGTLACIWIANQSHTYVLLIFVKEIELLQKLDQSTLSERISNRSLECNSWVDLGEILYPSLSHRSRNQIALVQDENQMFVWTLVFEVVLNKLCSGTIGVSRIKNVQQDIRTINDLVKLFPDSFALPL
jgi:hypothetical protein